jgi:hypothetical protein
MTRVLKVGCEMDGPMMQKKSGLIRWYYFYFFKFTLGYHKILYL